MKINCYDSTGAELKNLTQWEQNRILKISGLKCDGSVTCHMFNNPDGMALVVPARYEGDQVITQVPNIFLQEASPIVIGVCEEAEGDQAEERMLCSFSIPVMHFAKPFDYHFVEDLDYRNWVEISNEVKEVLEVFKQDEEKLQGVIANGEGVYERLVDLETSLNTKLENGEFDGFSPTASVAKSGDVTTITITDKDGTTTAEVKDYTHSEEFSNLAASVKADAEEVKRITEGMVKDLTNYYQKSETYSQEEINQLVSAIPKFALEVVDVLPKENISGTTIYLLTDGKEGNLYTEYIYVNEKWEILGSQQIDLSGYYTSTKVDELLAGKQPIGDYALKSDIKPSAQADWSVNDELDPAFVKNRIGGYDVIEKDYLINKTDAVFNFSEPDKYVLYFPDKEVYNKLQEGQFVVIDWGDKTCQSVVKRLNNSTLFIGDGSLFNQPHLQSTEPFCFNINKNQVLISTKETGNKRTVKARRSVPRTIDKKYIPTDSLIIDTFYTQWNAEIWKQIQDAWDENKKIFINLAPSGTRRYTLVLNAFFAYDKHITVSCGAECLMRIIPAHSEEQPMGVTTEIFYTLKKETSSVSNNYYYQYNNSLAVGALDASAIGLNAFAQGDRAYANGDYSHAEGSGTAAGDHSHAEGAGTANAIYSHAEGQGTYANGDYSHAEGSGTAAGDYSHAEGTGTANGDRSHAEGAGTANGGRSHAEGAGTANGDYSHAEGVSTTANGDYSHAEGDNTEANGLRSHTEGFCTIANGKDSHAEGEMTFTHGLSSHAEGNGTFAYGSSSHAEGGYGIGTSYMWTEHLNTNIIVNSEKNKITISPIIAGLAKVKNRILKINDTYYLVTDYDVKTGTITLDRVFDSLNGVYDIYLSGNMVISIGEQSHSEGCCTASVGSHSHAEGYYAEAIGNHSHAEGLSTDATGDYSHAEGQDSNAIGVGSHAEGVNTIANGYYSHAEGYDAEANGAYSHAEGTGTANGDHSHAEGEGIANGDYSHAEGTGTANGGRSHAEGVGTANGDYSHAEGVSTTATGDYSHAEGDNTEANGLRSHTEGSCTIANGKNSHAQGKYNIPDTNDGTKTGTPLEKYAHIVGNGDNDHNRSNAHTLDWQGNGWYQGDVLCGGENMDDPNAISLKKVAEQAGTQADWNISDPSNSGFIKNKPFGETIIDKTIFSETLEFGEGPAELFVSGMPITIEEIKDNVPLSINWDDNTYQTIVKYDADDDGYLFGNLSLVNMGEDTKEPFLFEYFPGDLMIGATDTSPSHTISIDALVTEITTIPEKYLPKIPAENLPKIKQPIYVDKSYEEWTDEEWSTYSELVNAGELVYVKYSVSYAFVLSCNSLSKSIVMGYRGDLLFYRSDQLNLAYLTYYDVNRLDDLCSAFQVIEGNNSNTSYTKLALPLYLSDVQHPHDPKGILISPNGTKYYLKVDDNGNLTTEKVV